jgi:hypothetical protein
MAIAALFDSEPPNVVPGFGPPLPPPVPLPVPVLDGGLPPVREPVRLAFGPL